jgi:hypothetical protein
MKSGLAALAAFFRGALTAVPPAVPATAGPGFHVALSHRRRLRLLQRRRPDPGQRRVKRT